MERVELQQVYEQAYKLGKQAWNQKVMKGESGYLRTLDGLLQNGDIVSEVPLGIVEIPLDKIVGTYTHGRSVSFATNFMPIMDIKTEFANKWMNLYNYHIESGIADPIKVYEYYNRFFVIEGNKRVSVLKFVGGTTINGQVIRLMPKRNPADKNNTIYFEFIKFYRETKINSIWVTEIGHFDELLSYVKQYREISGEEDDDRPFLSSIYRPFRQIYHELGGTKTDYTTGDALVTFLTLYGLPQEITPHKHKNKIKRVIKELEVLDKDASNVKTDALGVARKKLRLSTLTDFITSKKSTLKVAFVYAKEPKESGWAYAHELGRLHIENVFKDQIKTDAIAGVPENEEAYEKFKELAKAGYDVIFVTNPTMLVPALKAAMEYKNVKFFNCSATHSYKSLTLYYGRIHEPRYLLGMIAGAITKTNILGYVAPYPISEVLSSINAFTLGAQAVNPNVVVKAMWTNKWDSPEEDKQVAELLMKEGADIISNEDLPIPGDMNKEYGVYHVDSETGVKTHYAMAIWNWGMFYEEVIKNILNGSFNTMGENDVPINFWQGLNNGIVDIIYSNRNINYPMKNLIENIKQCIVNNEFHFFEGPIFDQKGNLKIKPGDRLDYMDIIHMDWLVKGVDATIPETSALKSTDPFLYRRADLQ